jgi:hypothetical protein
MRWGDLRSRVLLLSLLLVLLNLCLAAVFFQPLLDTIYWENPLGEDLFPLRKIEEHMLSLPLLVVWVILMVLAIVPLAGLWSVWVGK